MISFATRHQLDTFSSGIPGSREFLRILPHLDIGIQGYLSKGKGLQGKPKRKGSNITFQSGWLFLRSLDNDGCPNAFVRRCQPVNKRQSSLLVLDVTDVYL